ncbi:hypothetical protein [Streptomyces umbrinus]|uniref:hypothetical protein n=1 Tax=Streptomyces umbrinus TaxID=67370 RepID=UPI0033EFC267
MVSDLLLFPHCDLHLVRQNAPAQLKLSLFNRFDNPADPKRFTIQPTPLADCEFEFFAPHSEVGHRFDNLPVVNKATGIVTAPAPGVFLFQIRFGRFYQVARLQVHERIVSWWFGNDSITTARDPDPTVAHAQPSIYAKFSEDPTGTDLIGDITGHGYVPLTSSDTSKVVISPTGRLRGIIETVEPLRPDDPNDPNRLPRVSGTLLGRTRSLPVRVVDYAKSRPALVPIQAPSADQADDQHNIVFLAEGFQQGDDPLFDLLVRETTSELFDKPRHQPYAMLEGSFNVFSHFLPSRDQSLTTGFRVTDTVTGAGAAGLPIPYEGRIEPDINVYTLRELITRVGLPKHNEDRDRDRLPGIWAEQNLTNFEVAKVTPKVVDAWKEHRSVGILHARDTVFGLQLGRRLADRLSGGSDPVPKPAQDAAGPELTAFIARLYEFYRFVSARILSLDPRRHPPERFADSSTSPGNSVIAYLGGLRYLFPPNQPIGQTWVPDDTRFKPSRGLIVLIVNDNMLGGTNINAGTLTAVTVNNAGSLPAGYADPANPEEMRRTPPPTAADTDRIVNVTAHELGHSFNLGDEYEEIDGDNTADKADVDVADDNLTRFEFLRLEQGPSRKINMARVKWLGLPRMRQSERLLAPSVPAPGGIGIRVRINPRHMAHWVAAARAGAEVHLRNRSVDKRGVQLPLNDDPAQYLTGLSIAFFDEQLGTIDLSGPAVVQPPPVFVTGSTVFMPLKNTSGQSVPVVEKKIRDFLDETNLPLNKNLDRIHRNTNADVPLPINGFTEPARPERLIGIYEGARRFAGGYYRPAGTCKMRNSAGADFHGEFCFVCKWLIVNRVDPGYHSILSAMFYPEAEQNG